MQGLFIVLVCLSILNFGSSLRISTRPSLSSKLIVNRSSTKLQAIIPGSPMVVGTIAQGLANGVSFFSNIMLARFALSWFPQLPQQFPILRPIFTVTEPYLKVFRSQIPPVLGFDISAIPALFVLDILSQTIVALGAEMPAPVL